MMKSGVPPLVARALRGLARSREHRLAFPLATIAILSLMAALSLAGANTRRQTHAASLRVIRAVELRGTIAHLNASLVMTARLAAISGERRWQQQFEEDVPRLESAIDEATGIATTEIRTALAETTGEAHRDILALERRVLVLAAGGDLAAARALIDGPEFDYLEDVYAAGLDVFGQDIGRLARARAADLDLQMWEQVGGLGLTVVLFIAAALAVRGQARLRAAMAQTNVVARTDLLTGLPNRRQFCEEVERCFATGQRDQSDHALLLIDLDRFKAVNDAHGHPVGDELLRLVGDRLRDVLRDEQRIARFGGDEFAFLMCCGPTGLERHRADPAAAAEQVIEALSKPFPLRNGCTADVGASIGIGISRPGENNMAEIMHRADVGLYRAKADGKGCYRYFDESADTHVRALALLESELRQAVADEAIVPHFQPLVDIGTGRIIGVEMLARWPHPVRGLVPPTEFIPMAEKTGSIGAMTVNLLRQGCRAATRWPSEVTLSCNVSPVQLRDASLPATIAALLAETGLPAQRLEVEITETALVGDVDLARDILHRIKALGVKLALDDFGTGYSSLRQLQLLPFDKLKIDRSFVSSMAAREAEGAKIVSAVIALGHSLGLSTVAEGVETEETAVRLRKLGCDIGQGWLFGKPMAAHHVDAHIADHWLGEGSRTPLVA